MADGAHPSLMSAASAFYPITPHNDNDLAVVTRWLIVHTAGAVACIAANGVTVTLTLPAGIFPLRIKRILSTGTTATGLTAVV